MDLKSYSEKRGKETALHEGKTPGDGAGENQKSGRKEKRKAAKKEMGTFTFILVLAVVCVVVYVAAKKIMTDIALRENAQESVKAEEILEQYLEAGEYQELYEYYESLENTSAAYRKYWEVGSAWNWMSFMYKTEDALAQTGEDSVYYGISYALSGCAKALAVIDDGLNDGTERGNEEILEEFREEILAFLQNDLKLTEEEVKQVTDGTGDWDQLERTALGRIQNA